MKTVFLFKNLYLQCAYHIEYFLLTAVLTAIAYVVMMFSLTAIVPKLISKPIWNMVADVSPTQVYRINMWEYMYTGILDGDSYEQLLSDVNDIEGVKCAGLFFSDSIFAQDGREDTLFVSEELTSIFPLKNTNGAVCDFTYDGSQLPIFVGYGLQNEFPVGTVFDSMGMKFKVVDVIGKNSCWPVGGNSFGELLDLDKMFVVGLNNSKPFRQVSGNGDLIYGLENIYYCLEPEANGGDIKNRILQTAADNGFLVYDTYMQEEEMNEGVKEVFTEPELYLMPLLLIIISTLVMMLLAILNVILRKRNIAIMYTVGYSGTDIAKIFTLENAVKLFAGFLAALLYYIRSMGDWYPSENRVSFIWYVLPFAILIAFVSLFIGDRVSLKYIRKINVAEVIGRLEL